MAGRGDDVNPAAPHINVYIHICTHVYKHAYVPTCIAIYICIDAYMSGYVCIWQRMKNMVFLAGLGGQFAT